MSFYDIDDILSENRLIEANTRCEFVGLSYLDPHLSDDQQNLPQNSKIKIPLWLAKHLSQLKYLKLKIPAIYQPKIQSEISADPTISDLHSKDPYYYQLALHLCLTFAKVQAKFTQDIIALLRQVIQKRLDMLMRRASPFIKDANLTPYLAKLTEWELSMYYIRKVSQKEYDGWRRGLLSNLQADQVVTITKINKKRKYGMVAN